MSKSIFFPPGAGRERRVRVVWAWGRGHAATLAAVGAALLVVWSVGHLTTRIRRRLQEPRYAAAFVHKDSRHYVEIAQSVAAGDWRLHYVAQRPHRQPLYPLLLAVPLKWAPPGLFSLAMVNVAVFAVLMGCGYLLVTALFASRLAGLATLAFLAGDYFLFDNISTRLLTEPLFVLLAFLSTAAFLAYVQQGQPRLLLWAAAASGLSYLVRPNGLFLAVTLGAVLGADDLLTRRRAWRQAPPAPGGRRRAWLRLAGRYLRFATVFVAVTMPSWAPRWAYCGAPLYHGYLSNFMWADSYEAAHGQDPARFSATAYFATHGPVAVIRRLARGLRGVYWEATTDPKLGGNPGLYAVACFGLVLGLATRQRRWWLLFAFMFLQWLPVVWSYPANPTPRIPGAALLPFALLFAAGAFQRLSQAVAARWPAARPPPATAPPAAG